MSPVVSVGVDALEVDAVELCVGFVEERTVVEEVVDVYSREGEEVVVGHGVGDADAR